MPNPNLKQSSLTPGYRWNQASGRYITANGRFVKNTEVRAAVDSVIDAQRSKLQNLSKSLQAGQVTLAEWQLSMAKELKTLHVAAAAAGRGGWAQMTSSDWAIVGNRLKAQYRYLNDFAKDIESGKQKLDGTFLVRTDLYGSAARGTHEEAKRHFAEVFQGHLEERRILGVADHCTGCLEQAKLGWQPIGTLDPIGAEQCATNCKCTFEFRGGKPEQNRKPQ